MYFVCIIANFGKKISKSNISKLPRSNLKILVSEPYLHQSHAPNTPLRPATSKYIYSHTWLVWGGLGEWPLAFLSHSCTQLAVSWLFWILLNSFGIFWILLALMEPFGSFWILLECIRIFWILMKSLWVLAAAWPA